MPIPKPKSGESEQDYVSRIMGNESLRSEYEPKQLSAIAYNTYREAKKSFGRIGKAIKEFLVGQSQ